MPQRTRAGNRISKYRPGHGRISDRKISWLRTATTNQIAVLSLEPGDTGPEDMEFISDSEPGTTYLLVIPVPGRKNPLIWNMTAMTTEELATTRRFFEYLFNLVDPIVRERDKVADEANARGDDSFARVYRPISQFVIRERTKRQDRKGVRVRPDDPSEGDGSDIDQRDGVRGRSDELADSESQPNRLQDDGETLN